LAKSDFEPKLDLIEVRRQLIAMRSQHSQNLGVTRRINKLLGQLAYLRQPSDRAHEKRIVRMVANAIRTVERILSEKGTSSL
jgi:hypothetical protein